MQKTLLNIQEGTGDVLNKLRSSALYATTLKVFFGSNRTVTINRTLLSLDVTDMVFKNTLESCQCQLIKVLVAMTMLDEL
jgi:hypothetical protein